MLQKKVKKIPFFFKEIMWSYDLGHMDPQKDSKTIIVQAINYGDLKHWRWVRDVYGEQKVKRTLMRIPRTELKLGAQKLASLIFRIPKFHDAPRCSQKKK